MENRIPTAIASGVIPSRAGLLENFLINRIVSNSGIMIGVTTAGILSGKFLVDGFEIVRENAFSAKIYAFTRKRYKI